MSVQQRSAGLSLAGILDSNNDAEDVLQGVEADSPEKGEGWDEEDGVIAKEGYCIECEGVYICVYNFIVCTTYVNIMNVCIIDQPAQVQCKECNDKYCEVCFAALHRKGTRKQHSHEQFSTSSVKNNHINVPQNGDIAVEDEVRIVSVFSTCLNFGQTQTQFLDGR